MFRVKFQGWIFSPSPLSGAEMTMIIDVAIFWPRMVLFKSFLSFNNGKL